MEDTRSYIKVLWKDSRPWRNAVTVPSIHCWSNSVDCLLSSPPLQQTPQSVSYPATSGASPQSTQASREPNLPPPERYAGDPGSCWAFLSVFSHLELQPSSFPSDRSRIAYLITLMSGRTPAWAKAVWEQQSTVCLSL